MGVFTLVTLPPEQKPVSSLQLPSSTTPPFPSHNSSCPGKKSSQHCWMSPSQTGKKPWQHVSGITPEYPFSGKARMIWLDEPQLQAYDRFNAPHHCQNKS